MIGGFNTYKIVIHMNGHSIIIYVPYTDKHSKLDSELECLREGPLGLLLKLIARQI